MTTHSTAGTPPGTTVEPAAAPPAPAAAPPTADAVPPAPATAPPAGASASPSHTDVVDVATRLGVSATRLARLMRQQEESGLTPTLAAALATVAREGPLTLGALAARERVAPPSITKVVGKLENRGLVVRSADEKDRRITRIALTPAGRRQLDRSRNRRTAWLYTRLQDLSPDELRRLADAADILERVVGLPDPAALSSDPGAPPPDPGAPPSDPGALPHNEGAPMPEEATS